MRELWAGSFSIILGSSASGCHLLTKPGNDKLELCDAGLKESAFWGGEQSREVGGLRKNYIQTNDHSPAKSLSGPGDTFV